MTKSQVRDIGHILIGVGDMEVALGFYRDLLGFQVVGEVTPAWTEVRTAGGTLTLYGEEPLPPIALGPEGDQTPYVFHVEDFESAADFLEAQGVRVKRDGPQDGVVWDPFGNVIGLHDHRGEETLSARLKEMEGRG